MRESARMAKAAHARRHAVLTAALLLLAAAPAPQFFAWLFTSDA